jgi:hypothetical protein
MNKKLRKYRDDILTEKVQWERDKEKHYKSYNIDGQENKIITIDCGGTHRIRTTLGLLCSVQGSMLKRTFSGYQKLKTNKDGDIFIDRDGKAFLTMINYLRNDR